MNPSNDIDVRHFIAMVRVKRRPWRWHHVKGTEGPAEHWSSECGKLMNLSTMTLKSWEHRQAEEPVCRKCERKMAKKAA